MGNKKRSSTESQDPSVERDDRDEDARRYGSSGATQDAGTGLIIGIARRYS